MDFVNEEKRCKAQYGEGSYCEFTSNHFYAYDGKGRRVEAYEKDGAGIWRSRPDFCDAEAVAEHAAKAKPAAEAPKAA